MVVVAGIDEAGYGPILGPLVVSATAFRMADRHGAADLWRLCRIGRETDRRKTPAGVKVADSKALQKGVHGFRVLEENLLPFLTVLGAPARRLTGLLRDLSDEGINGLSHYPWYRERDLALPHQANPQRVADRALQLQRALRSAKVRLCCVRLEVLTAGAFNCDIEDTANKAATLAKRVAVLLRRLWDDFGLDGVRLVVDKQGGRNRYAEFLGAVFPECEVAAEHESAAESCYHVREGPGRMEIIFRPRADRDHLPTALASMLCKYTRELFMSLLNAYWRARLPGLRPTAGYVVDGRRFVGEVRAACDDDGIDPRLLVRRR